MSRSLNKAILIGNVGSDPEMRSVGNGGRVAQFSLATGRVWNDASGAKQEKTEKNLGARSRLRWRFEIAA